MILGSLMRTISAMRRPSRCIPHNNVPNGLRTCCMREGRVLSYQSLPGVGGRLNVAARAVQVQACKYPCPTFFPSSSLSKYWNLDSKTAYIDNRTLSSVAQMLAAAKQLGLIPDRTLLSSYGLRVKLSTN